MTSSILTRTWPLLLLLLLLLPVACASATDEAVDHSNAAADSDAGAGPSVAETPLSALPVRTGEPEQTTGGVPHIQTTAIRSAEFAQELARRAYSLPGVENRESIVSLPGATSLWLAEDVPLVRPELLPAGREFGHIHPDGSLHLWLPIERALEVADAQWGELHPWVGRDDFWAGVVIVWTPESTEEVDVLVELIVDSYNFLTGASLKASEFR